MNRLSVVVIVSLMALAQLCRASVPPMISYQGKLMQPSGAAVPDGTYGMQFAIYDVPTGGTPLWSETNPSVQVKGGLFSVLLGSVVNLPGNIFDNPDRWFGVKVGSDPEMMPRQKIASVPYAQAAGNGVPVGGVIMWSGAANQIPQGWTLCDGTNGTPDLRDRFVVGAGLGYAVGDKGGEAFHTLTVAEMPSHTHIQDPHNHTQSPHHHTWGNGFYWGLSIYPNTGFAGSGLNPAGWDKGANCMQMDNAQPAIQDATATNQNAGGDQPHENRPPYYALCFIMKAGS